MKLIINHPTLLFCLSCLFPLGCGQPKGNSGTHAHERVGVTEESLTLSNVDGCNNGKVSEAEQCDDGNGLSGDGCSSTCHVEPDWNCVGSPSSCRLDARGFNEIVPYKNDGNLNTFASFIRNRQGMSYAGIKIPWTLVEPEAPVSEGYSFSDFALSNAGSDASRLLSQALKEIHASSPQLKLKIMQQGGSLAPSWVYDLGSRSVRKFWKINYGGGKGLPSPVTFPSPWDSNLRKLTRNNFAAWRDWLNGECSDGPIDAPKHKRLSHFYAFQVSAYTMDSNTEMPDSYEGQPRMSKEGSLKSMVASSAQLVLNVDFSPSSFPATSGIVLLEAKDDSSKKEAIFYTEVLSDSGGGSILKVAPPETVGGGFNGRGWNGGVDASGSASGAAQPKWTVANTAVRIFLLDPGTSFGSPGNLATLDLVDPNSGEVFKLRGIFALYPTNKNLWVRFGLSEKQSVLGYTRNGISVVSSAEGADVRIETGRLRAIARAWMNNLSDLAEILPQSMYIWIHGGHVWDMKGAEGIGNYDENSPNDAVRDFVTVKNQDAWKDRVIWGYTNSYAKLSGEDIGHRLTNTAGFDGQWQYDSLQTVVKRGFSLGVQTESMGKHEGDRMIDYQFVGEVLLHQFGKSLRFVESCDDRSSLDVMASMGDEGYLPRMPIFETETGNIPHGLAPFPGYSASQGPVLQKWHEMLFGYAFGAGGQRLSAPSIQSLNLNARIRTFSSEVKEGSL